MGTESINSTFPSWYEDWLFASLKIDQGNVCQEKYLKPLISLNNCWLQENYSKDQYDWHSQEVATAYALYYMTANIPKLWMILDHAHRWNEKHLTQITSITELGCGPGTFLWAYLFYLHQHHPTQLSKITHIRGVDHSQENLDIATELFRSLKARPEFAHIEATFTYAEWQNEITNIPEVSSTHHLTIFGNSLIESRENIDRVKTTPFENLLILEPGTSKHFKRLQELRDSLVENNYSIHFPCPGNSPCPMKDGNWCHFSVNRFLLPFMQKISTAAGRKNHRHHFSAFLFSKKIEEKESKLWRILSNTRKAKGSAIRFLCNGQSIKEVVLNKKEKSDTNRYFIKALTGSCARCSSSLKSKRLYSKDHFSS